MTELAKFRIFVFLLWLLCMCVLTLAYLISERRHKRTLLDDVNDHLRREA
jgi:heme exporter protein D